jgi:DNA-binding IclR family transcriptional regulator
VVASREQMVVVARVDAPGDIGFAVRLGYHRPLPQSTSGLVLFAYQPESIRLRWLKLFDEARCAYDRPQFLERAERTRSRGFAQRASDAVRGVTDLSAPILQHNCAIAALTVPFVEREAQQVKIEEALTRVKEFAAEISHRLQFGGGSH